MIAHRPEFEIRNGFRRVARQDLAGWRDIERTPSPPAGPSAAERAELVERPDVRALYQEIIDALNRELSQFERIKRIAILPREFSIETGELTPSLKVKRKVVEEKWAGAIESLYGE